MIEIKGLKYAIAKHRILDDLELAIGEGEYYALAGENGAGKSTLIKIMLDLIRNIEQGEICIGGFDHRLFSARKLLTYLPEKFDLKKDVSGWQYLHFVFGVYRRVLNKNRVEQLCQLMGLDISRLEMKAGTYSKGMRQKLGLISCFMLDNPLIILDEPLSGLDPKARFYFKQLLKAEREYNRTIFYSTHMLADAEEICDQFGILHKGRIVFDGSPQSCLRQFDADTLERAYMNCVTDYKAEKTQL